MSLIHIRQSFWEISWLWKGSPARFAVMLNLGLVDPYTRVRVRIFHGCHLILFPLSPLALGVARVDRRIISAQGNSYLRATRVWLIHRGEHGWEWLLAVHRCTHLLVRRHDWPVGEFKLRCADRAAIL